MVREAPFTFSWKVAIPVVFVIETAPVVVNPWMLLAASVPLKITGRDVKFNIPPPVLARFPCIVIVPEAEPVVVPVPLNVRL